MLGKQSLLSIIKRSSLVTSPSVVLQISHSYVVYISAAAADSIVSLSKLGHVTVNNAADGDTAMTEQQQTRPDVIQVASDVPRVFTHVASHSLTFRYTRSHEIVSFYKTDKNSVYIYIFFFSNNSDRSVFPWVEINPTLIPSHFVRQTNTYSEIFITVIKLSVR